MQTSTTHTPALAIGGQSVTYRELLGVVKTGDRLKIDIKSDAYRAQSHARIERWDGNQWQLVWSIPAHAMATPEGLYVRKPTAKDFRADTETLVAHAATVLGLEE
jgi:hypothetical protein